MTTIWLGSYFCKVLGDFTEDWATFIRSVRSHCFRANTFSFKVISSVIDWFRAKAEDTHCVQSASFSPEMTKHALNDRQLEDGKQQIWERWGLNFNLTFSCVLFGKWPLYLILNLYSNANRQKIYVPKIATNWLQTRDQCFKVILQESMSYTILE